MSRRALALVLAMMTIVAAACSVPRDNDARIVTNPKPDPSVPITRPDGPRTTAKVYFVRSSDNKLEAVTTSVRMGGPGIPPGPYELLEALIVDGPPPDRKLESKIPNNVRFDVRPSPIDDERIVLLPNFDTTRLNREALILAFQQIVFTLTELPDVNGVQFSVGGVPYKVPLRSGDKQTGVGVRRLPDYDSDTIFTTTTTTQATTTTPPPASTPPPGTGAPGSSNPQASAPPGTSR